MPGISVKRAALSFPGMTRPWSALSPVLYSFNPFLIGLEFFLPLDLLFSVFFFYMAARLECVALAFFGADVSFSPDNMVAPYVREQSFGALIALLSRPATSLARPLPGAAEPRSTMHAMPVPRSPGVFWTQIAGSTRIRRLRHR